MKRKGTKLRARQKRACAACKKRLRSRKGAQLVQLRGSSFARAKADRQALLLRFGVRPVLRRAVIKLNKLPFLFTWETGGGSVSLKERFLDDISLRKARKQKRVNFHTPFVEMVLDPNSPHSTAFLKALDSWRKEKFPRGKIQEVKSHYSDKAGFRHIVVIAPGHGIMRGRWNFFEISPGKIDYWMESGRAFMAGIEKLAGNYYNTRIRQK